MNPYLTLLRVEFTVPRTVASRAVRSYRTLSPLPVLQAAIGGLLSVALVVDLRRPDVIWHPALWSPDFPPPVNRQRLSGQLSGDGFYAVSSTNSIVVFLAECPLIQLVFTLTVKLRT